MLPRRGKPLARAPAVTPSRARLPSLASTASTARRGRRTRPPEMHSRLSRPSTATPPASKSWCYSSGTGAISGPLEVARGTEEVPGLPRDASRRNAPRKDSPRLDTLLVEKGLVESRARAQALVMAGAVRVDGDVTTKAGYRVTPDSEVVVESPRESSFVSRAGEKLDHALGAFGIRVEG